MAVSFTRYIVSGYQEKITRRTKRQKAQFEETEQALEPDMAEILELSVQEFKTTMIDMLKALVDKVDSMQKHPSSVRDMNVLGENQKEMLEINTVIEMKNVFDKFISRLDMYLRKSSLN